MRGLLNEQHVVKALTAQQFLIKVIDVVLICKNDEPSFLCSAEGIFLLDLSVVGLAPSWSSFKSVQAHGNTTFSLVKIEVKTRVSAYKVNQ